MYHINNIDVPSGTTVVCVDDVPQKTPDLQKHIILILFYAFYFNTRYKFKDFVEYALTDSKAIALRKRLQYTRSAEEFFFATLNKLKDAPGNRMKLKAAGLAMPRFSQRFWGARKNGCLEGYLRHKICIVSASDLPFILNQMKKGLWFYNKYLIDYDHVVNDCIQLVLIQNNFNLYKQECHYNEEQHFI
uniref:Uncharacterized protein n=1 Tax=Amphimedon queenslandica TaxID=400682 RepID=A0A1X7TP06_AMPQE